MLLKKFAGVLAPFGVLFAIAQSVDLFNLGYLPGKALFAIFAVLLIALLVLARQAFKREG